MHPDDALYLISYVLCWVHGLSCESDSCMQTGLMPHAMGWGGAVYKSNGFADMHRGSFFRVRPSS